MTIAATVKRYRTEFLQASDGLALAVVMSLPWSTSATSTLVVLWLCALLPTLDFAALRRELATPAGGLPVLLVALAVVGMLWSDVSWAEAFRGLAPFAKLLVIPLLLIQFERSDRGTWVLGGFLVSCSALLVLSLALAIWPNIVPHKSNGVPVKDYIAQAGEFVLCAYVAAYVAFDLFRTGSRSVAIVWLAIAGIFLFDVLYIANSRTALATLPILLLLLGWRQFGWKGAIAVLAAGMVLGAVAWTSSPYLRHRLTNVTYEVQAYEVNNAVTSAGERLDFWQKSLGFMSTAPVIGHGTGSIRHMFEGTVAGKTGAWARPTTNPHNQILAMGIQLGLLGVAILAAMWLSHLLLFRGEGLVAWIGLLVVAQNVISSLFNSHLFDFTEGWIYVFGVGIAGGTVLRDRVGMRQPDVGGGATLRESPAIYQARSGIEPQRPL